MACLASALCVLALGVGCANRVPLANGGQAAAQAPEATPVPALRPASRDVHARTVRSLASADFETRSRAARRLVAAGDASLPALGRAGDMPVAVGGGVQVSSTKAVVRAVLAGTSDDALVEHLGSPWPNVRREAATELGSRDRWAAVPRLIDHLEDGDADVRAASAAALRRVTNNFFGYRARADVAHRRARADRWRAWWSLEGRAGARAREVGAAAEVAEGS